MIIISGSGVPWSGVLCLTLISQRSWQLLSRRTQRCQRLLQKASSVGQDGNPYTQPIGCSVQQAATLSQALLVHTGINCERARSIRLICS